MTWTKVFAGFAVLNFAFAAGNFYFAAYPDGSVEPFASFMVGLVNVGVGGFNAFGFFEARRYGM